MLLIRAMPQGDIHQNSCDVHITHIAAQAAMLLLMTYRQLTDPAIQLSYWTQLSSQTALAKP